MQKYLVAPGTVVATKGRQTSITYAEFILSPINYMPYNLDKRTAYNKPLCNYNKYTNNIHMHHITCIITTKKLQTKLHMYECILCIQEEKNNLISFCAVKI